ncbi:MAG: hypothetical protein KF773_15015 [Deltaproteobacteria bacterium]|nr:hypothetical protein [Deltaproteobacteria bacterium]
MWSEDRAAVNANATATCPANTVVIGGGCTTSVPDNRDVNIARSFPSSDTTWSCGSSAFLDSTVTAFAICARLAP